MTWKCCGCDAESKETERVCDCTTSVLYRQLDGNIKHTVKDDAELVERCQDQALQAVERERCATLTEQMIEQKPWCDHLWARAALAIAARTIRRGRHLTAAEKLENLAAALEEDGGREGKRAADHIRATIT